MLLTIFDNLTATITINELQDMIKISLHNKAPGPIQISNKIFYQLLEIVLSSFLNIMNACLQLEYVPKG